MKTGGRKSTFCKLFALFLAGVMFAGGCGKQDKGNNNPDSLGQGAGDAENTVQGDVRIVEPGEKPQYVASFSSMEIPLGAYGFQRSGNVLYAVISDYSAGENHYYKEAIADNSTAEELMTSSAVYKEVVEHSLGFRADDFLYFVLAEGESETGDELRYYLVKCAADGRELIRSEITEQMAEAYEEGNSFQNAVTDGQGRIYIVTYYHIYLYDEEGTYQGEVTEPNGIVSIGRGRDGKVYYTRNDNAPVPSGGLELLEIDFAEKKALSVCRGFPKGVLSGALNAGIEYDFLINDGESLYGFRIEDRTAERILAWSECDVKGQSLLFVGELNDGEFLAVESGSALQMVHIRESDGEEELPQREILTVGITCNWINGHTDVILQDAIARYNREQDRYRVELKVYGDPELISVSSWASESHDGVEALTMELVTGKGPDLIFKNGYFPIYAKRGLLEDLSGYLEGSDVLSKEDYLESALEIYIYDDKLVVLPSYISLDFCYGYTDQIGEGTGRSFEEILKLKEKNPGMSLYSSELTGAPVDLLFVLSEFTYSFIDWEKGTCDFQSEEFRMLLEYCNSASGGVMDLDPWNPPRVGEDFLIEWREIRSYSSFVNIKSAGEKRDITMIGYPVREGTGCYILDVYHAFCLGISSQSKHKEGAWEFLEYLQGTILKEMDRNIMMGKDQQRLSAKRSSLEQFVYKGVGEVYTDDGVEYVMTEEDAKQFIDMLENASPLSVMLHSTVVYNIIQEEAGAYFAGDQPVEKVMENIQRRIQLYLSENY